MAATRAAAPGRADRRGPLPERRRGARWRPWRPSPRSTPPASPSGSWPSSWPARPSTRSPSSATSMPRTPRRCSGRGPRRLPTRPRACRGDRPGGLSRARSCTAAPDWTAGPPPTSVAASPAGSRSPNRPREACWSMPAAAPDGRADGGQLLSHLGRSRRETARARTARPVGYGHAHGDRHDDPHAPAQPQAILFDLDGTLVDTVGVRVEVLAGDVRRLRHPRRPRLPGAAHRHGRQTAGAHGRRARRRDPDPRGRRGHRTTGRRALRRAQPATATADRRGRPRWRTWTPSAMPWAIATSSRPEEAVASVALAGPGDAVRWSSTAATSSTPSPPPTCCSRAPTSWTSHRRRPGTWATRAGTCWPRWRPGMTAVGIASGATSEADLRAAGAAMTFPDLARFLDRRRGRGLADGRA